MLVTADELRRVRRRRSDVNHETYKGILATLYARMRARAKSATQVVFRVPAFVPGRPLFDPAHAVRYVTRKLERGGFRVAVSDRGDRVVVVDWAGPARAADAEKTTTKKKKKRKTPARGDAPAPDPAPAPAPAPGRPASRPVHAPDGGGGVVFAPPVVPGDVSRRLALLKAKLSLN